MRPLRLSDCPCALSFHLYILLCDRVSSTRQRHKTLTDTPDGDERLDTKRRVRDITDELVAPGTAQPLSCSPPSTPPSTTVSLHAADRAGLGHGGLCIHYQAVTRSSSSALKLLIVALHLHLSLTCLTMSSEEPPASPSAESEPVSGSDASLSTTPSPEPAEPSSLVCLSPLPAPLYTPRMSPPLAQAHTQSTAAGLSACHGPLQKHQPFPTWTFSPPSGPWH